MEKKTHRWIKITLSLFFRLKQRVLVFLFLMIVGYLTGELGISHCYAEKMVGFSVESDIQTVRLNFVMDGGFPKKVDTKNLPQIKVLFKDLQVEEKVKRSLESPPSIVKNIKITEGEEGVLEILLADPKAQLEYLILPITSAERTGTYRLVFDVVTSKAFISQKEPPLEKILEEEAARLEKQPLSPMKEKEAEKSKPFPGEIPFDEIFFVEANKAYDQNEYNRAISLYKRYIERNKGEHISEAHYGLAISLYRLHEKELAQLGIEVSEALQQALDKSPNDPRAPLVRCFLANVFLETGMTKRAQNIIEEILKGPSPNDATFCAWKTIGRIHLQRANYIETIKAFYEATKLSTSPQDAAEMSLLMGKTLSTGGAYKPALGQLKRALELYPAIYLEHPEFLKILGETLFGMRDYQGALKAFLWYLNLSPKAPSDDMLWAYIAETLLQSRKEVIAERLQNSIIVNMPDTEGGYIMLLRKAQMLEEKGKHQQALTIYEDLATKSLPEALSFILNFRWASLLKDQKRFEEALAKVNGFLENLSSRKEGISTIDEFIELKGDIVRDWLLEEYQNGHYQKVVEIYKNHLGDIVENQSITEAVATSFYKEKDCFKASELFEKLLLTAQKPPREWLLSSAYCAYVMGEFDKAETLFRRIPDLDREHAVIFGKLLMIRKKFAEAKKIFEKLISSYGFDKETAFYLIECLIELKDWNYALQTISNVTNQINDLNSDEQFRLFKLQIQCLEAMKRVPELIQKVTEAINIAPSQEEKCQLIYKLYNLYISSQQLDLSESTLKQLSQCEDPFWKKVGEEGLRYLDFVKRVEGKKKASEVTERQ
ncbi:MAG: tetratricopeptide repeat protein [Thermodesulforhabdaceae bacterium]